MAYFSTYLLITLLIIYVSAAATTTNVEEFPQQKSIGLKRRVNRVKRQWGWGYLAYPTTYMYRAPYVGYYGSWRYPVMGLYG
ncbi:unnamed protein product [Cylicocyclus nassatus]|uniref:Uncharacterized protein n=1 Tax=Cylicocyclus nassatus TaxID=53992 RepID=A0AA36MAK4_CYLNA|nr:unnamed protein product [Cylicocyclus nassatus]